MNTIRASLKRSSRTRTRKNDAGTQPLQVIQECSETDSRVTLSAFQFSIDDALLILAPPLSASSSSDSEMPVTPDDEDLPLPTPRLRPNHITIRPLCITKSRCADHDDISDQEDEYDFYTRQFQDFISLYSPMPSPAPAPARPDSIILSPELPPQPQKPPGRSRFSKALPLLPLPTPPLTTVPPVPQLPAIRRKRVIPPLPIPPPIETRPPPRMAVPSDIEDDIFEEEEEPTPSVVWFDDEEDYSQPSFVPAHPSASTDSDTSRSSLDSLLSSQSHSSSSSFEETAPISPFSFPPTPRSETHQLRSRWSCSTISSLAVDPPRTILSPLRVVFGSKSKSKSAPRRSPPPLPIFSSPRSSPSASPLQTRTNTQTQTRAQSPYKMPLTRMVFPTTPSPPSTPTPRHIRRQNSRSSTSSGSSESGSCESGGSSGLRRKPIPVEMFLRA
ncbi:hypothetical protein EV702DRAFT_1277253 [Suillus placidus]|uniref:Uncharacterized protein n=1 Tax=Suillus placidus TaxID=48579 RepID=A0A9P6ZYP5_9AGAM|nr:hypothetical protein EV702DRAFT_1277253 [Suillus placidus]